LAAAGSERYPDRHGQRALGRAGHSLGRRDLPGAHALREGRRAVGSVRRRHRRRSVRRRLARRAQPQSLDGRVAVCALALLAAISGCGDSTSAGGAPSSRLVDFSKAPPYVNAFDIDPRSRDFLLTTNRGFYRIKRDSGRVRLVRGTITVAGERATLGTFLQLTATGPGRLLGSGHPDQEGVLQPFLGLIGSGDGGDTWQSVSRLGQSDLHRIVAKHGRVYAIDAAVGAFLVSRDEGRAFDQKFAPSGAALIDFEVDPADPQRILASSELDLYRSPDGGATWKKIDRNTGIRLAWPAADAVYRALKDGTVQRSSDGGSSWIAAGRVGGEPYKFKAVGRDELYLALSDGTILHTTDAAKTWREAFRP